MGVLAVTIGPVSSQLNFDNTKGATIIDGYLSAYNLDVDEEGLPLTLTNQEKLDRFVTHLGKHAREAANGHLRRAAEEAARLAADAAQEDWN